MRTGIAIRALATAVVLAASAHLPDVPAAFAQPPDAAPERPDPGHPVSPEEGRVVRPESTAWHALIEQIETLVIVLRKMDCIRVEKKGAPESECDPGCHCTGPELIKSINRHTRKLEGTYGCVMEAEVPECRSVCAQNFKCLFASKP